MQQWILATLSSAAVVTALLAMLAFLLRNAILERLKNAVAHEYAEKLEHTRAKLSAENNQALEALRAENAAHQSVQAVASAAFGSAYIAAHERRLSAVDVVWKAFQKWKSKTPRYLDIADLVTPEQYDQFQKNPKVRSIIELYPFMKLGPELLTDTQEVEDVRPFVGNLAYAYFSAFRIVIGRLSTHFVIHHEKGQVVPSWYDLPDINHILELTLTPEELEQVRQAPVMRITLIRNFLELKLLAELQKVISGQTSATAGLEQAGQIAKAVSEAKQKSGVA